MPHGDDFPTLMPHQADGVELLLATLARTGGAALLADPPGAGKTAMAIGVLRRVAARRTLVLCPASLKLNWRKELLLWGFCDADAVQVLRTGKDALRADAAVVVCSYNLACREPLLTALSTEHWDALVLDEAHKCRKVTSQVSRVVLTMLWPQASVRLPMTGTPIPNGRADEAWPLFSRLAPQDFGTWLPYKDRYVIEFETAYGVGYRSKNLDELGRLARERFMVRRRREDILPHLPPMVRTFVPLEIAQGVVTEAQGDIIDVGAIVRAIDAGAVIDRDDPISTARRKLGIAKTEAAVEFILDLLDAEGAPLVVLCHHKEVFFGVAERLADAGVSFRSVSGKTPTEARQSAVDDFQAGRVQVFLGSLHAVKEGITLTKASTVIFVEYDWVPSTNEQGEGRVWRIGATDICRAFYLTVPGSLDEAVLKVVVRKQRDIQRVMAA